MRRWWWKQLSVVGWLALFVPGIVLAKLPNDPFAEQWAYTDIKAPEAWEHVTGSRDVIVAVLDNGFDHLHPDLLANVWKNEKEVPFNGIDDDRNGYIDDVWGWNFEFKDRDNDGTIDENERKGTNDPQPDVTSFRPGEDSGRVVHHGTFVAGLIGAVGNNRLLGSGLNWQVRLMNVKVVGNSGSGEPAQLARAIRYAVDNGAHIINISMVSSQNTDMLETIQYAYDRGVVVVAAAGNESLFLNKSPQYPVCIDAGREKSLVLGVSAITHNHQSALFSNVGSDCIDITAPGVDIASTIRFAPTHGLNEQYQRGWSGTSFATPLVSGAAALIKAIQPTWGPDEIYTALLSNTHKTPPPDEAEYANLFGKGLLQIDRAVQYALAHEPIVRPAAEGSQGAVVSWQRASGLIGVHNIGEQPRISYRQPVVRGVDDLAVYERAGRKHYVTVRQVGGQSMVISYSELWEVEWSWVAPLSGPLGIVVANITDDSNPEVVLAPRSPSQERLRIYRLDGTEITRLPPGTLHNGVRLGLYPVSQGRYEVLAVFKDEGIVQLHHYDEDGTLVRRVALLFYQSIATPRAGDVDGDGVREYMVVAEVGEAPLVAYVEPTGEISRVFPETDLTYTGGLSATVADYDQDGKEDVLMTRQTADYRIRIWNFESRKIGEWQPFLDAGVQGMEIVSVY